ncbi:DUF2461 family protein [Rhizobium deserti]|uniref:DUF2461 family protein n=1 Tax=Rhizobium deserti TaxID=2547961 RepID=A0A4R5UAT5_9HYPH|nr:DUF2461 family protein [Rhizobium deserti]TDK32147.1 DUF2461 family protein [Rhizobium deserti]
MGAAGARGPHRIKSGLSGHTNIAGLPSSHIGHISVPFMFHYYFSRAKQRPVVQGTEMIDQSTLKFLSEASSNQGAEWLTDNKAEIACARRNLMEFTSQLITRAGLVDPRIATANIDSRKCLARASVSKGIASITVRVSLSKNAAATYFMQISPSHSYSGGGALLPPPRLARILRQTIASHTGKWRGIVESPLFQKYFPNGLTGGLDAIAQGYVKNHDALDFFNLKNFGACRGVPDEQLMSTSLVEETVKSFAAARALVDYINRATTRLPEV